MGWRVCLRCVLVVPVSPSASITVLRPDALSQMSREDVESGSQWRGAGRRSRREYDARSGFELNWIKWIGGSSRPSQVAVNFCLRPQVSALVASERATSSLACRIGSISFHRPPWLLENSGVLWGTLCDISSFHSQDPPTSKY